ncbi:2,4-dihydroxyhept-2-enedioate aldolase [Loktanella fryxellensis]|uniref:Hydroxypyruvate/pyruvate aldolase n=1 Tax=Loktanella fryxellensis TaxID=245187 RepID=A0A1H7YIQ5_9RHOB|nr:HpcH/HpaI aldolase/citrate lyase family protein [Loktanella fryxellensis]SEM45821.1 2,4-dihydroxyhept-2-enedioate aldolase [Loktanella fryxellensis]
MDLAPNTLKQRLQAGEVLTGLWLSSASTLIAELAGQAGFDWCLIDGEHSPQSLPDMLPVVQALASTPTAAVIRIPAAADWMVKQALDLGAAAVLVPLVHDAATATLMASAMRYPPHGHRGMGAAMARASRFGAVTGYVHQANANACLIVQAESRAALDNIDAIAAVDGVDGVFIGPADLSADMGFVGQLEHPEVDEAIDHIIARTHAAGKFAGVLTFNPDRIARYRGMGVEFLGVGGDIAVLAKALRALALQSRGAGVGGKLSGP